MWLNVQSEALFRKFDRCNRSGKENKFFFSLFREFWDKRAYTRLVNLFFLGYIRKSKSLLILSLIPVGLISLSYLGDLSFFNITGLSLDNSLCYLGIFPFTPIKEYENPDLEKESIFSDNKDKSGIYCWVNKINGKFYIGSASNLGTRLRRYYSLR